MQRILVTGSTGALGAALVVYLKNQNKYQVIVASRTQIKNFTDYVFDVTNSYEMRKCLKVSKPDIIFHIAATYSKDFEKSYKINIEATKKLLDIVTTDMPSVRVILIGSAAEYGAVNDNDNPIREDFRLNPITTYGMIKAWQTILMHFYCAKGANIVLARIFNLYGDGITSKLLAGSVLNQIKNYKDGIITKIVTGDLSKSRDYISVEGAAKQLECIAVNGKSGEIYHVGSGVSIRVRDFVVEMLKRNKISSSVLFEKTNNIDHSPVSMIYADMTKTKSIMKVFNDNQNSDSKL